jgi:CrcB protein
VLAVNMAGCLLIGVLAGVFVGRGADDRLRLLLATGFLGSFTTFSAFGLDTFELVRAGRVGLAAVNAGVQVGLGAGLVALGWWLGQRVAGV